jgi:hypothetical protein
MNDRGTPRIFYTSIGGLMSPASRIETWQLAD